MLSLLIYLITLQMVTGNNPTAQHLRNLNTNWLYHEAFLVPLSLSALIRLRMRWKVAILVTCQLVPVTCICLMTWNFRKAEMMRRTSVRKIMILTSCAPAFQISVVACLTMQWWGPSLYVEAKESLILSFEYVYKYRSNPCFYIRYYLSWTTFWGICKAICQFAKTG